MTFSVIVCDPKTKKLGIAVATCHFAVGALVPHLKAGVGAIATQAATNPYLGINGLEKMDKGLSIEQSFFSVLEGDSEKNSRQLHGVDYLGNSWAWTGNETIEWAGHINSKNYSVAGNMLACEEVLKACVDVIESNEFLSLEERMLRALQAGECAGGDKRGRQSAVLMTIKDQPFPFCNIRVDDNKDPLTELERLLKEFRESYYQEFISAIPNHHPF